MSELWISLLEVKPLVGSEYEYMSGAYTHGLAYGDNPKQVEGVLRNALESVGFELVKAESTETLKHRIKFGSADPVVRAAARKAARTKSPQFSPFNSW